MIMITRFHDTIAGLRPLAEADVWCLSGDVAACFGLCVAWGPAGRNHHRGKPASTATIKPGLREQLSPIAKIADPRLICRGIARFATKINSRMCAPINPSPTNPLPTKHSPIV